MTADLAPDEFKRVGHRLVDEIAEFLSSLEGRPVVSTKGSVPTNVLGETLPEESSEAHALLARVSTLLLNESLLIGHPRFFGWITGAAAPIGILGDFLASALNPNCGARVTSPIASRIEDEVIRWISDLVAYPQGSGGLMVSGGSMANYAGMLVGFHSRLPWNLKEDGWTHQDARRIRIYASSQTHAWLPRALSMFGPGTRSLREIPVSANGCLDAGALAEEIERDKVAGAIPLMVSATVGTTSTGASDPLTEIAAICKAENLWLHVDGAYGAPAAALNDADQDLKSIHHADSIALDPHKWMYAPIDAGCVLVRDAAHLLQTFGRGGADTPDYYKSIYRSSDVAPNYFDLGLENSRRFRALKVWLVLAQMGKRGYLEQLQRDIDLAGALYRATEQAEDFEARSHHLGITTFRYLPQSLTASQRNSPQFLNQLNRTLLATLQEDGRAFLSDALVNGEYRLRACLINFRTTEADLHRTITIIRELGQDVLVQMDDAPTRPSDTP